jgi:uncharacterized membrane protein SpoIIM required for sporulation
MPKIQKIGNYSEIKITYLVIFLFVLILILSLTNIGYYLAYTIDYLANRHSYTFKEESQYAENHLSEDERFDQRL